MTEEKKSDSVLLIAPNSLNDSDSGFSSQTPKSKSSSDSGPDPCSEKPKTPMKTKYLGPNGQPQHKTMYKPGHCHYGCDMIIPKSEQEAHKKLCPKYKEYRVTRDDYYGNKNREKEQPSRYVLYEDDALESKAVENKFGWKYGQGPVLLKKAMKDDQLKFNKYKEEKRTHKLEKEARRKERELRHQRRAEREARRVEREARRVEKATRKLQLDEEVHRSVKQGTDEANEEKVAEDKE